jgi:hypothetical protein
VTPSRTIRDAPPRRDCTAAIREHVFKLPVVRELLPEPAYAPPERDGHPTEPPLRAQGSER